MAVTANKGWPLPNSANTLAVDEPRLEAALVAIDAWAGTVDTAVAGAQDTADVAAAAAADIDDLEISVAAAALAASTANTTNAAQGSAITTLQGTTATHTTQIGALQTTVGAHTTTLAGLGNAATKNVGSTAGTVAAGDHTHTGFQAALGFTPANKAGDTFTGATGIDVASGRQAWVGAGDVSSIGAGTAMVLYAANLFYDRATGQYKTSANGSLGYRGIRMTPSLGIEFTDGGATLATTAGVAVTPAWNALWHSGNTQVPANALARRISGSGDTLVLAVNTPYRSNTAGGAYGVVLPNSAVAGDSITVIDESGSWSTNALTIDSAGKKINGVVQNLVCDVAHAVVRLFWPNDDTAGWKVE